MKRPLVSVIVPIFNTGKSAVILVDCLLHQSYRNLEVILVDDGSVDKSGFKELEGLGEVRGRKKISGAQGEAKGDLARVRFYHKKNGGAASARNYGLKKAQGEFVAFIDSDDLVTKDFIEKLAKPLIEDREAALSVCGFRYVRLKEGEVNDVMIGEVPRRRGRDSDYAYLLRLFTDDSRFYSSVNKMYRTEIIRENGVAFDETLEFAEDTDFVVRYLWATLRKDAAEFSERIAVVREAMYIYNFGTETSTVGRTGLEWKNWQESFRRFKELGTERAEVASGDLVLARSFHERIMLKKLRLRFSGSHLLAVERSAIPESEKRKYVRPFSRVKLMAAKIVVRVRR